MPSTTTFRGFTGYFYAYDPDDNIDDSQETAWFSWQHEDGSDASLGIHIADSTKQLQSSRNQLRSQLRLLARALPDKCDGLPQHFAQYGFTNDELPEDALLIAQFRTDIVFSPNGSLESTNTVTINQNLPDTVLVGTKDALSAFAHYATNMFDMLDSSTDTNTNTEYAEYPLSFLATIVAFDSNNELDEALTEEPDIAPLTISRLVSDSESPDSIQLDARWHLGVQKDPDTYVPMVGDFFNRLLAVLPDEPLSMESNYPAFACYASSVIPDNATVIAQFVLDISDEPPMPRCLVNISDQGSYDTLALLRIVLTPFTKKLYGESISTDEE